MKRINAEELSAFIRKKTKEAGFDLTGIARARKLTGPKEIFSQWINSGMNGHMAFLERDTEKRFDPDLLFPGAVSVVVTGLSYGGEKKQGGDGVPVLSRYAYGKDYHVVISDKLNLILQYLKEKDPAIDGKAFVDFSAIHEKTWAVEAGIGWQGRNSLVINERSGSFFFIGILLLNAGLEYDEPVPDRCGECRLCIEACPTMAINDNHTIDARKCIAYHTTENKGMIPTELSGKFSGRVFGCDICQEACPWNRKPGADLIPEFRLSAEIQKMSAKDWVGLTPEKFNALFGRSPAARIKYERMMRNVAVAISSNKKKADFIQP
jgi:epoxyqueuosine reductase